jgi:hypothetical protein
MNDSYDEIAEQEDAAWAERRKSDVLSAVANSLHADLDTAIRWRLPIEQRWIEDLRQKHGEQPRLPEVKSSNATLAPAEYRHTNDNITRPATIQIAARLADMMFPTDEKNWDLKPSPIPELTNPDEVLRGPDGQPLMKDGEPGPDGAPGEPVPYTMADLAKRRQELADQKCTRMKQAIDDALQECRYAKSGRRAIQDACDIGTGVIKGPVIRRTRNTAYRAVQQPDGSVIPNITVETPEKPSLEWVDLWNFFPQPCRHIEEAEHAYELHLLTKKKVRELANQPGFDPTQVNELLKTEPDLGTLGSGSLVERDKILSPTIETLRDRYAVWEYRGPIPKEVLEVMGIPCDPDDKLTTYDGEVWFSQSVVLKVSLSPDDFATRLPYYLFTYERDPSCCFGFSVPYVMRADQYAVNQTWHAVMLNAMMSAGIQVGVVPGMMEPVNGKVDVSCLKPKTWAMKSDVSDIKQVLSFFAPPNNTAPLMEAYEKARRNASEKTLLPQFMDGEAAKVTQTSSGLAMLMNSANVVQREGAKGYDDEITVPAITAMARWFLLDPKTPEDAKGDYETVPKGESYLLVKDIQAQHVQVLTQIADMPKFAPYFDPYELLQLNVRTLSLPLDGLLRDKQTVENELKQQAGQPDPLTLRAQAAQTAAEAAMTRAQGDAQKAQIDAQLRQQDRELSHMEHQALMLNHDRERIAKLTIADGNLEIAAAKVVQGEQAAADKARLQQQAQETEQVRMGMDATLKAEQIAASEHRVNVQVQNESPVRI